MLSHAVYSKEDVDSVKITHLEPQTVRGVFEDSTTFTLSNATDLRSHRTICAANDPPCVRLLHQLWSQYDRGEIPPTYVDPGDGRGRSGPLLFARITPRGGQILI